MREKDRERGGRERKRRGEESLKTEYLMQEQ